MEVELGDRDRDRDRDRAVRWLLAHAVVVGAPIQVDMRLSIALRCAPLAVHSGQPGRRHRLVGLRVAEQRRAVPLAWVRCGSVHLLSPAWCSYVRGAWRARARATARALVLGMDRVSEAEGGSQGGGEDRSMGPRHCPGVWALPVSR